MKTEAVLTVWRAEIACEIEGVAAGLTAARDAAAKASAEAAADAEVRRLLRAAVARGVGADAIAGALAARLAIEDAAGKTLAGAAQRAKGELANIEYRLGELHAALTQIDRALAPPRPAAIAAVVTQPEPPQSRGADIGDDIVFPMASMKPGLGPHGRDLAIRPGTRAALE